MNEKKPHKELKILSTRNSFLYALPNVGIEAIVAISVNLTLIFYINVLGQPPIFIGGIYSAALYFLSFMCIFWGVISDKIGKKKVMLFSGPLMAIAFTLIWIPPIPNTDYGQVYIPLLIWFILFAFLFRSMIAAFQSSLYSMLPVLSTEDQNRVKISMISMILIVLGTVTGTIVAFFLMSTATKDLERENPDLFYRNSAAGRLIYSQIFQFAILISILFLILTFLMLLFIKEPKLEAKQKLSLKTIFIGLKEPFQDTNNRLWIFTVFIFFIPLIAFQFLLLNIATFVLNLRGIEYMILFFFGFISAILSFFVWQKLSIKFGLKKVLSICLMISLISFISIFLLLIPMNQNLKFVIGNIVISLCLCSLVGTNIFPFVITSKIIDAAELKSGKNLSGSYFGAYTMIMYFAAGTSMLIVASFLEIYGPEVSISYGIILGIVGSSLLLISVITFQKVQLVQIERDLKK